MKILACFVANLIAGLIVCGQLYACPVPVPTPFWLNQENAVVVKFGTGRVDSGGVNLISRGGFLIPVADAVADPFTFFLSNSQNQVTFGMLGRTVAFEDGMWTSSVGYDLEKALADGVDPLSDLSVDDACSGLSRGNIVGDSDFDGRVTFADFLILSSNFEREGAAWPDGDFNWDKRVDFADFLVLADNFGADATTMTSVPEPDTSYLLLVAAAPLLIRSCAWGRVT